MINPKFIFIILLLLCETAYSNPCEFTAKVTPERQTKRVKGIYEDTCAWFIETFDAVPSADIPLDEVEFIQTWRSVERIENPDRYDGYSHGVFFSSKEKAENKIFISENPESANWNITPFWIDSLLAHEIVHYLMKASRWDSLSQVERMNIPVLESHAYWSQDKYIRRHSGGTMGLEDFLKETDEKIIDVVHDFERSALHLLRSSHSGYLYNAIRWFNTDPEKKFNNIVSGRYTTP